MFDLLAETSLLELLVVAASVTYALFRAVKALRDKSGNSAETEENSDPAEVELQRKVGEVEHTLTARVVETTRRVAKVEIALEELTRRVAATDHVQVERLKSQLFELDQRISSVSQQSQLGHAKVMRQFRKFLAEEKPEPEPPGETPGEAADLHPEDRSGFALGDLFDVDPAGGGGDGDGPVGLSAVAPIAQHRRKRRRFRR